MLIIDYEKAFDKIEWNSIFKTLWVREPDDHSRQSSGIHTFTRYTCTAVTRIYSAVTDSHGLYNMLK